MAITSVDSFIRIFKFYQANPLVRKVRTTDGTFKTITLQDIFRENSLIYQDTVDVYLHSLTLDKLTQLSYDTDSDTIQHAINAREKLSKYFSKVLYPGSYAYSTLDNAAIRKMMLDWSSTIKTIQDANRKVTNAYSLSSDDVDKAIRGFGVDFVNSTTIKSVDRRKNFLLKMCELYSIKGSPDSIIQALNVIGLEDIFIREAWICKDVEKYNGDYDLRIQWKAQKLQQEFDSIQNMYVELNTHDDIFTTWDWFQEKIAQNDSTFDPHWFYKESEIKLINNDPETFIKLPSITPYFGIEFTTDLDKSIDSLETLFAEINKEYQQFFLNEEGKSKTIWVDTFPNRLNALECYTGLIYTLIRVDEHIQYENFKSYLELNKFSPPEFKPPYEYFKLINWVYQHRNDGTFGVSYNKLINSYIPIKSNTYTSYENVLKWWLEEEVADSEKKLGYDTYTDDTETTSSYKSSIEPDIPGFMVDDNIPTIGNRIVNSDNCLYIQPRKVVKTTIDAVTGEETEEYSNFITLEWDNPYPTGRYCVESWSKDDGWVEIVSNGYVYETTMQCSVLTDYAEHGSEDVSDFRIAIYHHPANIPEIFFHQPFIFDAKPTNTLLDRVIRYNGPSTGIYFYDQDDPLRQAFINQQVPETSTTYDVVSGYHSQEASGNIRTTQIHDNIKAYYCSVYNYPVKTKLYEDKWMNINALFYDYVDWASTDYYDTITHNGLLETNRLENAKWPINKRWNWAIDSKYFYVCYEANKWMRYPVTEFVTSTGIVGSTYTYGDRIIIEDRLFVYVGAEKWAVIDGVEFSWDNKDSDLITNGRIKSGSELSRTLAVGQIKSQTIINLLRAQTDNDKQSEAYKESQRQLNQSTIEIYTEPYGNELVTTNCYTYSSFLTYLYNNRLTLDFTSGYIYPVIEGYVDSHCRVYLKCKNPAKSTVWIRFNNTRDNIEWNNCEGCQSIYTDKVNLGLLLPPYSLPNRYDSLRMLDGRTFNYRKELLEAFNAGTIPDDINLVVVRAYKSEGAGEYAETEAKYKITHPVVYKKVQVVSSEGSLKLMYDWVPVTENRLQDCKLGINPDLLDWIEDMFATNIQNYIDLPSVFAEALNNYLINDLGISGSVLDLIIASWSNSSIVKKIINFYKPKRARLLFISDALDSEYALSNGLDALGLTDHEYNYYDLVTYRWGNPNFDTRNLSRMNRQRIAHVIHEYMPVEDTVYKDGDESNKLFNYRELQSSESKIPEIEVYDELVDITRQKVATRNGTAFAVFYVQNLKMDDSMNGFYYQISLDNGKKIYSNNSWYFQECEFVSRQNEKGRIKITLRWALFKADNNTCDKDLAYYVADQESEKPWIADNGDEIKYADCTSHARLIDDYDYLYGDFITDRYVKVNLRNISPVFYFRCFSNEACNGFYYYDPAIHSDRNDCPVYYNLKGKMITLVDTTNYYTRRDPSTGNNVTKFWCIMDYKQIADFNSSDYFAYATSYTNEEEVSLIDSANPDFTKEFHRIDGSKEEGETVDCPSALVGCTISFLNDHKDLIRSTENVCSTKYDIYENFKRNHLNTVKLRYNPIGALIFNNIIYNADTCDKRITVTTDCQKYSLDHQGNSIGAIDLDTTNHITMSGTNSDEWSIAFRVLFKDQQAINNTFYKPVNFITDRWYMITVTSEVDYEYFFGCINDCFKANTLNYYCSEVETLDVKDHLTNSVSLIKANMKPYLDYVLEDTYGSKVYKLFNDITVYTAGQIAKFTDKEITAKFNTQRFEIINAINSIPQIDFGYQLDYLHRMMKYFNLVEGDTYTIYDYCNVFVDGEILRSNKINFLTKEQVDIRNCNIKLCEYGVWDAELDNWYVHAITNFRILRNRPEPNRSKTAVGSNNYRPLYATEEPRVVFDRWSTGLPENIVGGRLEEYFADKYKQNHEVNPLWVNRLHHKLDEELIVKGAAYNQPSRDSVADGICLESSGDYITPDNRIQWWWLRYNKDFRTGPIHHRPVYVSAKHLIDDPYPFIKYGQGKKGDYCDIGLSFDGVTNVDTSCYNEEFITKTNPNVYDDETYDENTGFGFKANDEEIGEYKRTGKVKLENFGDTYKTDGSLHNTYILDLAQLKLTAEDFRNFMFHDTVYLYNMPAIYSEFNGTWTRKTTVKSWREGDFKECYAKGLKFEAVFTYHKDVGYFWWEIRKLNDENVWETYFRTYVNARHNQSRLQYVYDLLNYHQIDISNQKLYKFKENEFVSKCWAQVQQEEVGSSFGSNMWVRFNTQESSELTHPGHGNYFDGYKYHITMNDKWYTVNAESEFEMSSNLPAYKTPSGYMYDDEYLYIWIDDKIHTNDGLIIGGWIRIACNVVTSNTAKIPYDLWAFRKTSTNSMIVNVIDSDDAEYPEEAFVNPDIIDIRETMWKLVKFNGINDWKWEEHMNEEFPYLKSVNNDIALTIASLQDTLWYQTFEVNAVGEYIKVKHANGVIDFVKTLGKDDERIGNLRYSKNMSLSNV